jgi:hypothetical protein
MSRLPLVAMADRFAQMSLNLALGHLLLHDAPIEQAPSPLSARRRLHVNYAGRLAVQGPTDQLSINEAVTTADVGLTLSS